MHVDMDAFFASVEQRDDPRLRGCPVVVGASPSERGVVAAASYEARKFGIRSAMSMAQAMRLCPELIRRPVHFAAYREVSGTIHSIFHDVTALIEPVSLDEAYLDLTSCVSDFDHAAAVGQRIKADIREQTKLNASVGIGPNKFIAKIASDHKKPNGFYVVQPDDVLDFLEPLPVRVIPGVGQKTGERLKAKNVSTIRELRQLTLEMLQNEFGVKIGERLHRLAQGIDENPVIGERKRKSLSQERTFAHDLIGIDRMKDVLKTLARDVAELLEKKHLKGRTVGIKVRFHDFQIATRAQTLDHRTDDYREIGSTAVSLLDRIDFKTRRVRLLGVRMSGFEEIKPHQNSVADDLQMMIWE